MKKSLLFMFGCVAFAASAQELPVNTPITTPMGELHPYYTHQIVRYPSYPYDGLINASEMASLVYFDDANNKCYFYNLLGFSDFNTYAEANVDAEKGIITMPLPQTLSLSYNGRPIDLVMMKYNSATNSYSYDPSFDSITYTYDPKKDTLMLNVPGESIDPSGSVIHREYGLGIVYADNCEFTRYVQLYADYVPYTGVYPQMPKGVKAESWTMVADDYAYSVNVAYDDEYVYIEGMFDEVPLGVVQAKLNGDGTATITAPQAQGILYDGYVSARLADSEGYLISTMTIDVDLDAGKISHKDPDVYIGWMAYYAQAMMESMNIFEISRTYDFSGIPANPTDLEFYEEMDGFQGSPFVFSIPIKSTTGNLLETRSLYYSIYLNDEIVEFESDEWDWTYVGLPGVVTEIPFIFNNGYDIIRFGNTDHEVGLYVEGFETVGVQSIYRYNGNVTKSDIVTLNIITGEVTTDNSGVDEIMNTNDVPVYYDLMGRRVANPTDGIFIMKQGEKTRKIMK